LVYNRVLNITTKSVMSHPTSCGNIIDAVLR
jgi:hypothetical protein